MTRRVAFAVRLVERAVARFMLLPGQATAYMIGMKKLQAVRQRFKTEKGALYNLRDFHDFVLGGGSLPLSILEQTVEKHLMQ